MNKIFPFVFGFGALVAVCVTMIHNYRQREMELSAAACTNNLRQLHGAKLQWAIEFKKGVDDVPTWDDLAPYLKCGPNGPECPKGGTYTFHRVADPPSCSIPMHQAVFLSFKEQQRKEYNQP